MSDLLTSSIWIEEAPIGAVPFVPTGKKIEFILEKIPEAPEDAPPVIISPPVIAEPALSTIYPPALAPSFIPSIIPEKKTCIIDIETTGTEPWNSRLICISAIDASEVEPIPVTFYDPDEAVMIREFTDWYNGNLFEEVIGYNVSFDMRYIMVKAMRYLIVIDNFLSANITDLMQIMKQTRTAYVFTQNKPGKLEDWMMFYWGEKKQLTAKDIINLYNQGNVLPIIAYNRADTEATYNLWALYQYTSGETMTLTPEAIPTSGEQSSNPQSKRVVCPECMSENFVPHGSTGAKCTVCQSTLPTV